MTEITLAPPDFATLGARWRALEDATGASFFQSWSWVGCLAAERYADPLLLEATQDGRTVALALFNRRRGLLRDRLWLHESGEPAMDAVFIEHNGILARDEAVLAACWLAARAPRRRLIASGIGERQLMAARAGGAVRVRHSRAAPLVDLAALRGDYLAGLSANARQQLRRSARRYGEPRIRRATTVEQALDDLAGLAALHQATWTARGKPGAFASPFFLRFHRALIAAALPRGEIDLLRIEADGKVLGYLYNFRTRGWVCAYQSGFDYGEADSQRKPGLTCHHLAIETYLAEGMSSYDFLGGDDRYKRSLANAERALHWVEVS